MKKLFTSTILMSFIKIITAQTTPWNTNGTNIYNPNTGNVGIGISTPVEKLDIMTSGTNGGVKITNSGNTASGLLLSKYGFGGNDWLMLSTGPNNTEGGGHFNIVDYSNGSRLFIKGNTGEVGIGTTNPLDQLHINGTLRVDGTNGNGGVRVFKNGSDAISSHIYLGNNNNNRAFNFQLNSDGSAMTLWSYNGTAWSNKMSLLNDGKIGIGTINPLAKLQVSDGTNAYLNVYTESNNVAKVSTMNGLGSYVFGIDAGNVGHIWNHATNLTPIMNFSINTTNSTPQVWIGSPDPTHTFAEFQVKGTIACKQLFVVSNTAWPDYVFKKDYKLMPLSKVEEFYTKENHLPGIPSAEEIKEKDIDVGEMNAMLLKKIEELTIYVVEQDKKIEALKSESKNK